MWEITYTNEHKYKKWKCSAKDNILMEEENGIDQLFKRGLSDPEIPFNELDWENMSRKLDAQEKKRVIPFWLYTASGIAAALAVFFFWITMQPAPDHKVPQNIVVKPVTVPNTPSRRTEPTGTQLQSAGTAVKPANIPAITAGGAIKAISAPATGFKALDLTGQMADLQQPLAVQMNAPSAPAAQAVVVQKHGSTPAAAVTKAENETITEKANALAKSKDVDGKIAADEIAKSVKKGMERSSAGAHALLLSAMAAPDISTAANSRSSKLSTNVGMLATYALGSRFSLTSGAIYAKKYYNSGGTTGGSIYSPASTTEWEVKADCNVLDIPLNVNYRLLHKKSLSVSVNTGLSSYFMLKEKYQYTTGAAGSSQQVTNTEFDNQNQHLFGIANVSVSFDHQISDNLSVGVQPFAKLPLTGIGNNDVSLKSTGVSFSISIGLFPTKKAGKMASNHYSSYDRAGL